jgi:predicted dehydrogenase/threonine dehydrogenase-like Zn-dependent dehydrogenase
MKQLLQNMKNGATSVADVPIPAPQRGEALVRNAVSLVSAGTERMLVEFAEKSLLGKARSRPDLVRQVLDKARREGLLTTLEAAFTRLDQPMPLGYSSAGTIVALGEGLEGFQVGQRVACAGGGYAVHAEYVCVPHNLLAPLPDSVDFEAAAFTTLGAIAMHGFRQAGVQVGERVAVIGLGLLGLLTVGIARAAGCAVFGVDLDPRRVELATSLGAQAVLREGAVEAALSFSRGRGCDAVLICADAASADPVELAGAIARDRARVIAVGAVGLQLPRKVYYEKELTFLNSRSYGPGRYDPTYEEGGQDYPIGYVRWTEGRNLEGFVDLLASGQLDIASLVTHRFPIEQAAQAYELITGKQHEPFLGVVLTYPLNEGEASDAESLAAGSLIRLTSAMRTSTPPSAASASDQPLLFQKGAKKEGPASTKQLMKHLRIGVLGAGNFASAVMLPALKAIPSFDLVGIASASGMSAKHAAGRFGFDYATSDEAQILNDPQVEIVAILTRHNLHARQVSAALRAHKHVFCEKPLALNRAELEAIQEALIEPWNSPDTLETDSPPLLTAGFNRRFAPMAQQMQDFLGQQHEPLAAYYRVNAGYIPLTHWTHDPEQGGGRIIGEGCHFIDFLTFLVGSAPTAVTAGGLPDGGRYREDNAVLTFTFPDGSVGVVSYLANGDKAFPKERVEVFKAGRVAVLDDFRSLELVMNGKRKVFHSRLRQDKGHSQEWQAFAAAIRAGGPAPIPYDQLFGVMNATFASVEALRTGEKVTVSPL